MLAAPTSNVEPAESGFIALLGKLVALLDAANNTR